MFLLILLMAVLLGAYQNISLASVAIKANAFIVKNPIGTTILVIILGKSFKYIQQRLRFNRLNAIKLKYGYTRDPDTWADMTIEQAQEIERNMAEWEFPCLWQFAWISDFLRTSTDPGVSRAIAYSGHFLHSDPLISHRRQQDTIHLMTAIAAYSVKSKFHSLAIARINEHHHRYGHKINSDDVLYLIIHFGFAPVNWINRFGYRKLEDFEIHAIWVLWREIACRMGVKYIPKTVGQAWSWRKQFEKSCRWREQANEDMATGLLNQLIYPIPSFLHPFARKLVVSIMDYDIVYYNQLEHLGPSSILRHIVFDVFRLCGRLIRRFALPRWAPYKRSPDRPNCKTGLMNFEYTPYETTPFYIEPTLWNLYGVGALFRRLRGIPLPNAKYFGNGIAFESMGAPHSNIAIQAVIEEKVRKLALELENAPYGWRPSIGFQGCRLLPGIFGPSYGMPMNEFPNGTIVAPTNCDRFSQQFECRGQGYSKVGDINTPGDVNAYDAHELAPSPAFAGIPESEQDTATIKTKQIHGTRKNEA